MNLLAVFLAPFFVVDDLFAPLFAAGLFAVFLVVFLGMSGALLSSSDFFARHVGRRRRRRRLIFDGDDTKDNAAR